MLGTLERGLNLFVLILLTASFIAAVVLANVWRFGQYRWRFRAWRNRRRHPHLARAYRMAKNPEARYLLAQQMMMRDRTLERLAHNGAPGPNYPTIWDYYFEPGMISYSMMSARIASRTADESRIRDEMKRIKTQHS